MSILQNKMPHAKLIFSVCLLSVLTGCMSTQDLNPNSKSSPQLSLNASKHIYERMTISAHLSATSGKASEKLNNQGSGQPIQIDNTRFIGNVETPLDLDYDFNLAISTLLLDLYIVKGDVYQLSISPGLSYVNYDIDINVNNTHNFTHNFNSFGYGVQLRNNFTINDKFSLNIDLASFDQNTHDLGELQKFNTSLNYAYSDNITVGLGYHSTKISDPSNGSDNGDNCDTDALAENCQNSEINLETSGILLNFNYKF